MNREQMLQKLEIQSHWDLIVIGGGATGLGTAVDAASRGYKTLLIEQCDFAKGTSSKSTKLIHGGLRYLKQGNIPLVKEALKEKELLFNNAPHLTHPLAFVIPYFHLWEKPFYFAGLKFYDFLAGKFQHSSQSLSYEQTISELPTMKKEGLKGGMLYYDGQFDDARLALTLAQTFADLNGVVLNYMPAIKLLKSNDRICGVVAKDSESGKEFELFSSVVVNATGAFCDGLRQMDEPGSAPLIKPSRGVHLVLPKTFFPGSSALMVPHTVDDRVLFFIPWYDHVLVGTTDTPVKGTPLEPIPSNEEIDFLLFYAAKYLTSTPTHQDILSVFAGLRPLVKPKTDKKTASISRDHTILISSSGLITVAGGKWTTYRKMGEDVVDQAAVVGQLPKRPCKTKELHLHGWSASKTVNCYGEEEKILENLIRKNSLLGNLIHPALPYRNVEVIWAVRSEMARTLEDVLARRTRSLFLNARASIEAAPHVAHLMAGELNKDEDWVQIQLLAFTQYAQNYLPQITPPPYTHANPKCERNLTQVQ